MGRFNIRVYGIWLEDGQVLLNDQYVSGQKITKFPGGGLEWGEGTRDSLIREWKEEMNIAIQVGKHIYTTDFFQPSAFDDSQVISIYYAVKPLEALTLPYSKGGETFYFRSFDKMLKNTLSLPIDKVVATLLLSYKL